MKRLLFIFTFLCFGFAFAQFAEAPQYQFNSTSSYKYTEVDRHYTVPVSEVQQPFVNSSPYRPRKTESYGPPWPSDPNWHETPVGDPDIFIIIFLLILYLVCQYLKNRKSQMLLLNIQKQ